MSRQSENFKKLVKGNSINNIITALNMLNNSVKSELKKEYKVDNLEELAIKLC